MLTPHKTSTCKAYNPLSRVAYDKLEAIKSLVMVPLTDLTLPWHYEGLAETTLTPDLP